MARRTLLKLLTLLVGAGCQPEPAQDLTELNATELAARLAAGELTAQSVTRAFLERIDALNTRGPALRAILEINPEAEAEARALDEAFGTEGPRGPLHGVPVVIKANIDVAGLAASAGSLALAEHRPTRDAHLVERLRAAGAVVLATANLSEWANFRDNRSSSGWSSLGGQTRNPHVLDRNPCGSSSGSAVAVAARMVPLAVGTETHGSIVCPAAVNGVVGIKPTVGLVSRGGIIPISHTQDTAGPLARNVADAALLLDAMMGPDAADPGSVAPPAGTLVPETAVDLREHRVGVLRTYPGAGKRPDVEAIFEQAVQTLPSLGVEVVDPVAFQPDPALRDAGYRILLAEFRAGIDAYLTEHGLPAGQASLAELIAFNRANAAVVMPHFGQSIFLEAAAAPSLEDPGYHADLQLAQADLRRDLDVLFADQRLDALVIPAMGPAWKTDLVNGDSFDFGGTAYLAALTGYPSIVLPAGDIQGLPIAVGLTGLAGQDGKLIRIAAALEAVLPAPLRAGFIPSLENP